MIDILNFLAISPAFHIATIDENNLPKVRPFSFVMEWNGKLTFVTNTTKSIYKQLVKKPYIEISSFASSTGEWMRIHGSVKFTNDIEAIKKVFEVMPELKKIYQSENNPTIICFYIDKGEAAKYSFTSMNEPTIIKHLL